VYEKSPVIDIPGRKIEALNRMDDKPKPTLQPEELAELLLSYDFDVLSKAIQIARSKDPFKIMRAFDKRMVTAP
jgi:hypothetical protein